jgi:hypothetical protein
MTDMTDPFVPEADALEQQQEVRPEPALPANDEENRASRDALEYPARLPNEASEADALEQHQTVELDEDLYR